MTRNADILFMTEYIKNVLYFATTRQGKVLKSTDDTHYFSIDDVLIYENYYSDFGPLNLGCVYKYCKLLNDKLRLYFNKQVIVHYTSTESNKKANAAFVLGCYGVLCLNLSPVNALKPLLIHGQSYRSFQDATQGESQHTITLFDCLQAIKKASDVGFFKVDDFNYEEYDRLDKIQGGDLNWIIPGKFLAFIGPVDVTLSFYHPPEMYIDYFRDNDVKIVIRLNKKFYNGNVFSNAGILHYDLFFPDGSCPPRNILFKFLQISEDSDGAIAVHCKAGLGRTGSLIGCYIIKHYRMTAREAIGWMRICRPGSVIGHQQEWLEHLEPWLLKQGNLYRKRTFGDEDRFPIHRFGVYSIAEKALKHRPVILHKSPSPSSHIQRETRSDICPPLKAQTSKPKEDSDINEDEEKFISSCDLTKPAKNETIAMKGCVIKNYTLTEEYNVNDCSFSQEKISFWKKYLCCHSCIQTCNDIIWLTAVRCANIAPKTCYSNRCCILLDKIYFKINDVGIFDIALNKTIEKEASNRRVRVQKTNTSTSHYSYNKSDQKEPNSIKRQSVTAAGGGDPRLMSPSRGSIARYSQSSAKSNARNNIISGYQTQIPTFRTSQGPVIKTISDARNILLQNTIRREDRGRVLNSNIAVTPHHSRVTQYASGKSIVNNTSHVTPTYSSGPRNVTPQPSQRRRLGRSPSPPVLRMHEQSRATNTPSTLAGKFLAEDASKTVLRAELSRLKVVAARDGSIGAASVGAASLGARRDAPTPKRAPSVHSDERPLATQGDLLNCIKFQRMYRNSYGSEKISGLVQDKISVTSKYSVKDVLNSKSSTGRGNHQYCEVSGPRERTLTTPRRVMGPQRPSSPKIRRNPQPSYY